MPDSKLKILLSSGRQFIPDLKCASLVAPFRGVPIIEAGVRGEVAENLAAMCPVGALAGEPLSLDLGRCLFCGECAMRFPEAIRFSQNHRTSTNIREQLIVTAESGGEIIFDHQKVRPQIRKIFGRALRLRQVSAGGDNSTEMELNAVMNVNFDFGRYGIDFVASPRHADGVVITGPITRNMAVPLEIAYNAIPSPKMIILAGTDAVSGGLFAGRDTIDRSFLSRFEADLYIPGNPVHPFTFIDGVMRLLDRKYSR